MLPETRSGMSARHCGGGRGHLFFHLFLEGAYSWLCQNDQERKKNYYEYQERHDLQTLQKPTLTHPRRLKESPGIEMILVEEKKEQRKLLPA